MFKNTLIVAVIFLLFGLSVKSKENENWYNDYQQMKSIIESDSRLYQHFVAVKYKNLPATKENIKNFIKEAKIPRGEEAFQVATKETGNGSAGVGKTPKNNHFGMKVANMRFSWSEYRMANNYVAYAHWTYSYLDWAEFINAGNKSWRKDCSNTTKTKKSKMKKNKK